MAQIINTNVASLTAQRNLNSSQGMQTEAMTRLSSGLRINSAKDDAAGLAISTRFTSQISGINVATRNAGDGVSLAQTAEGALGSMTDALQRIRELALQSANGTNTSADREALNAEAQQLISEISATSEGANFNGNNLLDGSFTTQFQVGANAGDTIDVAIAQVTTENLGVSAASGVSAIATDNGLANGDLVINGVQIRASTASDDTSSTSNAAASAIAKVAAINASSADTGVTATADTNTVAGTSMTAAVASGNIIINGTTIALNTTADAAQTRAAVAQAINDKSDLTGVTAIDSGEDSAGVTLEAADGRNISIDYTSTLTAENTGLVEAGAGTQAVVTATSTASTAGTTLSFETITPAVMTGDIDLDAADLDFRDTASSDAAGSARGAMSFTVTSDAGSYTVLIDGDYKSNAGGLITEINTQISGSGVVASQDATTNALVLTESDATAKGFITIADGSETGGYAGGAVGTGAAATAFGSFTDQEGNTSVLTASGNNNAATFDIVTTDRAGSVSVNTVTLDESITTLDSLITAINDDLGVNRTVEASNSGGALQFRTVDGFEGGIDIGNFSRETNDASSFPSDAAIDDLFGFDITGLGSAGPISTGNGVTGNVDLEAATTGALTLNAASVSGTAATVSMAYTAFDFSAAPATLLVSLDGVEAEVNLGVGHDFNTTTQGVTEFIAAIEGNLSAIGVDVSFDGTNIVMTENDNNGATLTVRDGDDSGTGDVASALAGVTGSDDNDAISTATVRNTGVADVTQNNTVKLELGTTGTVTLEVAAATYATTDALVTALNTAITADNTVSGVVQAFNNDGFVSISLADVSDTQTISVSASSSVLGTASTLSGQTGVISSLTSTVTGDAEGELATAGVNEGGYTLVSDNATSDIVITGGDGTGNGDVVNSGLLTGTYSAGTSTISSTARVATDSTSAGAGVRSDNAFVTGTLNTDTLTFSVDNGTAETITLSGLTGTDTIAETVTEINSRLSASTNLTGATAYAETDDNGNSVIAIRSNNTTNSGTISTISGTASTSAKLDLDTESASAVAKTSGFNTLADGDLKINGVAIGASKSSDDTASYTSAGTSDSSSSGIAIAAAINDASDDTGVTATVNATQIVGGSSSATTSTSGDTLDIYINGTSVGTVTSQGDRDTDRTATVDLINTKLGQTGVSATDNGTSITLTAADGRNISIAIEDSDADNNGAGFGLDSSVNGIGEGTVDAGTDPTTVYETTYSTISLASAGTITLEGGTNGDTGLTDLGFKAGTYGGAADGTFVKDIDISTLDGANAAITAVDNALAQISSQRATLGSVQNRFEATISNLSVTSENLSAANSRILDADFAAETASLSKAQVLQQAGISILAQANALPQQVLSLLQ